MSNSLNLHINVKVPTTHGMVELKVIKTFEIPRIISFCKMESYHRRYIWERDNKTVENINKSFLVFFVQVKYFFPVHETRTLSDKLFFLAHFSHKIAHRICIIKFITHLEWIYENMNVFFGLVWINERRKLHPIHPFHAFVNFLCMTFVNLIKNYLGDSRDDLRGAND